MLCSVHLGGIRQRGGKKERNVFSRKSKIRGKEKVLAITTKKKFGINERNVVGYTFLFFYVQKDEVFFNCRTLLFCLSKMRSRLLSH